VLGVLVVGVVDVGCRQLAPVQRWHVVPLHALSNLESPHAGVGARLPRLGEIGPERDVVGVVRLLGEGISDQAVAGETHELEQPDRLREPRIDHGRIPGRRAGENAAALRGLGLAGIQWDYLDAAAAARRPWPRKAAADTPAAERRTKSRRFRRARGPSIASPFIEPWIEGKDRPGHCVGWAA